jgi:cyclase
VAIRNVEDMRDILRAGADKVSVSTALVGNPELLSEAARRHGSEALVVSIGARAERRQIEMLTRPEGAPIEVAGAAAQTDWFRVFTHGGRNATQLDAVAWAKQLAELGAGEIVLTSIAQGVRHAGYDLEMTARVVEAVGVPVVANGDIGQAEHIRDVFLLAGADAALAGGILRAGTTTVARLKRLLHDAGIPVRTPEPKAELNEQQLP